MNNWFTSAVQTIREKSFDALDFVRRDLNEFTTTVKTDTGSYINKITTGSTEDGTNNRLSSKLNDSTRTNNDYGKNIHTLSSLDRINGELVRIQNDESTYLINPSPIDAYETWCQTNFNAETRKGDIAQLLIDAPHVRFHYARLVPAQTTHSDFWSRYYYRLYQIEQEEERRTQLLQRAHKICSEDSETTGTNNENDWDEPDDECVETTSTESQQEKVEIKPVTNNQEIIVNNATIAKESCERKTSDTGDSWEREFDETDIAPSSNDSKSNENLEQDTTQTATNDNLPLPTTISSTTVINKKEDNEISDEWESWS